MGIPGQIEPGSGRVVHAVNLGVEELDLAAAVDGARARDVVAGAVALVVHPGGVALAGVDDGARQVVGERRGLAVQRADVAARAGVSTALVSIVMREAPGASAVTRERVTPPRSAPCRTKFSAPTRGSS